MKNRIVSTLFVCGLMLASCKAPVADAPVSPTVEAAPTAAALDKPAEAPTPTSTPKSIIVSQDGKQLEFVPVKEIVSDLVEDLKYATTDNFMHRKLYSDPRCYLLRETAAHLAQAQNALAAKHPGYKLKVWDCYRPMTVQEEMWKAYTNTPYVANPKTARHPRGRAVDITIVDESGREVEMPTGFDDFSRKAHPNAPASAKAAANRQLLNSTMTAAGFTGVNSEWWHFDYYDNGKPPRSK